jgi:3-mercaptopyruvate sulfurtransferase SseA
MSKGYFSRVFCALCASAMIWIGTRGGAAAETIDPFKGILVSPAKLATKLTTPGLVIIDTRSSGYENGHIPGAVALRWEELATPSRGLHPLPELEKRLGDLGFDRHQVFVIYDAAPSASGAGGYVFWLLDYLGCEHVHLLDGGWRHWTASGKAIESTGNHPAAGTFNARINPVLRLGTADVAAALDDPGPILIDGRGDEAFNGWIVDGQPRGGHIPGAIQFPHTWLFNTDGTLLDTGVLKKRMVEKGIARDRQAIVYSSVGLESGYLYVALKLLGYAHVSHYDGSLAAWSADSQRPLQKMKNHEKLVNAAWVERLIAGKRPPHYHGQPFVILETSYGNSPSPGSIPGAVSVNPCYFESENDTSKYYPHYDSPEDGNLLPDARLHKAIANLGIDADTLVVVYGKGRIIPMTSCRVAWALMFAGVKDVRLLNGGYTAWLAHGGDTVDAPRAPSPVPRFNASGRCAGRFLASNEYVEAVAAGKNTKGILVDVRELREYKGTYVDKYLFFKKSGHIPTAVWQDEWTTLVDMTDDTLRNYEEVSRKWKELGVTPDREPIFYCGTGWRSSIGFFQAYLMGFEQTRNYDNSFYGWWWKSGRPVSNESP